MLLYRWLAEISGYSMVVKEDETMTAIIFGLKENPC